MSKTKFFKDIFSNKTKFKRFKILLAMVLIFIVVIFIISRIGFNKKDGLTVQPVDMKVDVNVKKGAE